MSASNFENDCGLIIDPGLLVSIQRQCRQRAAELAGAGAPRQSPAAPGSLQSGFGVAEVSPPISETERFAAVVQTMPANIRRFFESEEPVSPPTSWESDEERTDRARLTDLGGWCG